MSTPAPSSEPGWPAAAGAARLHFVTGKGGTGKSTVAAALALALAAGGRKVLLVEVEGRQTIAQLFDVPPLPYAETRVAVADGGGVVTALAIDIEAAFLEYLDMFYNLGFAGKAMKRIGAVEFATTLAPGLRDVLLTGKIKECAVRTADSGRPVYDAVVVDAPPTGRIGSFLDVTRAMADLAKGGPIRSQSEGVIRLLHSDRTMVHLVTLLEALPVQETADAVAELRAADLRIGSVVVNRSENGYLPAPALDGAAEGHIDSEAIRRDLDRIGLEVDGDDFAGLLTEAIEHAIGLAAQRESADRLDELQVAQLTLPKLVDGVDLGGLYELAEHLTEQGVR
ncbi:ArsA family ATPase [Speluncibacter jeojiensis]|uniref:ATPase n=1 Tax=Speluncibacter jeojiensis TaxID=2710754 RepID=A0A9X4RJA5_9ACTN|nr:ArsA-related P-loop ATPase [Rhodococcus sp. D2-41]MDG3016971.1 ATPase [Corynebacteriales bacterium D3-21]